MSELQRRKAAVAAQFGADARVQPFPNQHGGTSYRVTCVRCTGHHPKPGFGAHPKAVFTELVQAKIWWSEHVAAKHRDTP